MKLWIISQEVNTGYDTFDAIVVAAKTEEDARRTVPPDYSYHGPAKTWAAPEHVKAECIGTAKSGTKAGIVLASFNAG